MDVLVDATPAAVARVAAAYRAHAVAPSPYNRVHTYNVSLAFNYDLEVTKTRVVATVRAMLADLVDTLPASALDGDERALVRHAVDLLGTIILLGPNDEPRRNPPLPPVDDVQERLAAHYLDARESDPRSWTIWLDGLQRTVRAGDEPGMHRRLVAIVAEIADRMRRSPVPDDDPAVTREATLLYRLLTAIRDAL